MVLFESFHLVLVLNVLLPLVSLRCHFHRLTHVLDEKGSGPEMGSESPSLKLVPFDAACSLEQVCANGIENKLGYPKVPIIEECIEHIIRMKASNIAFHKYDT